MLQLFECNSVVLKKTAKNTLIFKHKEILLKVTSIFQNNKVVFSENQWKLPSRFAEEPIKVGFAERGR